MCNHTKGSKHPQDECNCKSQELKIGGFLIPCLLLLIKNQPSHGYALIEKIRELPFIETMPDPGVIYRYLRNLEEDGLVKFMLHQGKGGPARKIYSLTPEGEDYLKAAVEVIKKRKQSLQSFIDVYENNLK